MQIRVVAGAAGMALWACLGPAGGQTQHPGADAADTRLWAAVVEWAAANCGLSGIPAASLGLAHLVANGAYPDDMDAARAQIREAVAGNFAVPADACSSMVSAARLHFD